MYEAVHIREMDVDLQAGILKIGKTKHHRPKTLDSTRAIPLPSQVIKTLSIAVKRRKVRGPDTYLFTSGRTSRLNANRGQPWNKQSISQKLNRIVREVYAEEGRDFPEGFTPRRLRASFATMLRHAGVDRDYIKRYVGHAPGDVLAIHYEANPLEVLRERVCRVIDHIIQDTEGENRTGGIKNDYNQG